MKFLQIVLIILFLMLSLTKNSLNGKVYSTLHKQIYIIKKISDIDNLINKQKKNIKKTHKRKIVKVELVRVIPRKGNNPFYQRNPVKNTYNPITGIVENRAPDEPAKPVIVKPSHEEEQGGGGGGGEEEKVCSINNLSACNINECLNLGLYWLNDTVGCINPNNVYITPTTATAARNFPGGVIPGDIQEMIIGIRAVNNRLRVEFNGWEELGDFQITYDNHNNDYLKRGIYISTLPSPNGQFYLDTPAGPVDLVEIPLFFIFDVCRKTGDSFNKDTYIFTIIDVKNNKMWGMQLNFRGTCDCYGDYSDELKKCQFLTLDAKIKLFRFFQ